MKVLLVGGFLGSGKTSFILQLAHHMVEEQGVKQELSRGGTARYDQQGGGQPGFGMDQIAQEAKYQRGEEQHAEDGGAHAERGTQIRARAQSGPGAEEQKRCGILKQKLSFVHALTSS